VALHFAVAGATGRTGRAFVAAALAAGHRVTAFVRDRAKAAGLGDRVALHELDLLDAAAVARALAAEHVIVSTLGGGGPQSPGHAISAGTANLVAAARACGASRMLAVVGAGVLQADASTLRSELPQYPPFLRGITAEHHAAYRALADSALDWTLVCVPDLRDGPASGSTIAQVDYMPAGRGAITTGDVAAFLVREAEAPQFHRTRVGLDTRS